MGSFFAWFLGLSALAYFMYVVAWMFESRTPAFRWNDDDGGEHIPVWRHQSKAFVPGDAALALSVGVVSPGWPDRISLGVGLGVAVVAVAYLRKNAEDDYGTAAKAPSKLYHDYIVSAALAFMVAVSWIPVWFGPESLSPMSHAIGLGALIVWGVGMGYDIWSKNVPNEWQHSVMWWTIWRKLPPTPF